MDNSPTVMDGFLANAVREAKEQLSKIEAMVVSKYSRKSQMKIEQLVGVIQRIDAAKMEMRDSSEWVMVPTAIINEAIAAASGSNESI